MTKLSVNINKVATIRNARGGNNPDVEKVAIDCESFGAQGITVHPRPDERHIRYQDVRDIKPRITTELNIEGNPIPKYIDLVLEVKPTQVTLVPDADNQITSITVGTPRPTSRSSPTWWEDSMKPAYAPPSSLIPTRRWWPMPRNVAPTGWNYTPNPMPPIISATARLPSHPSSRLPRRLVVKDLVLTPVTTSVLSISTTITR